MMIFERAVSGKGIFKVLAITMGFNTLIAVFLTFIGYGKGWYINFVFSQSLGLSICGCVLAGKYWFHTHSPARNTLIVAAAIGIGTVAGSFLASALTGIPLSFILHGEQVPIFQLFFLGLLFGTIITYFFMSREEIAQARDLVQEERIRRLSLEKENLESRLRLLQAQVEPHFLFNSLSTILSLLETDSGKGKEMLADLTRYLRASLSRTRGKTTTLEQEMDLIRAYMNIYKVRMGDRLRYRIEIPEHLKSRPFPPMLVQPLVENAIRHGLEPRIDGGEIFVGAEEKNGYLQILVSDNGMGLDEKAAAGIGLSNIRERLQTLFDGEGKLILQDNNPSGLKAILEIPNQKDK
ncbi:MAG: sensor histidine kinase [Syntrophaceae bacterium]|nr:sensor histidine kinase [Syntrophaceae bacterium]